MPKIKFNEKTGFAVLPAQVRRRGKAENLLSDVRFKVDTGASASTINIEALRGLDYDDDWVRENGRELTGDERPRGFSGEYVDGMYEIHLPHIKIGLNNAFKCRFMTRLNTPSGANLLQLLLGLDILSNFNWSFNFDENEFSFSYRRHPNSSEGAKRRTVFHAVED
jgi:hypothetical protein